MKIKFKGKEMEIPEGATFKVVGGDLVVSPGDTEFKDGDFIVSEWKDRVSGCEWICILKGDFSKEYYNQYASLILNGNQKGLLEYEGYCDAHELTRKATSEECNLFLDAIEKDGKHWNNSKRKFEDILKVGDICIFWDDEKFKANINTLTHIDESDPPYRSNDGRWFNNAIKCTSLEQYQNFISEV